MDNAGQGDQITGLYRHYRSTRYTSLVLCMPADGNLNPHFDTGYRQDILVFQIITTSVNHQSEYSLLVQEVLV